MKQGDVGGSSVIRLISSRTVREIWANDVCQLCIRQRGPVGPALKVTPVQANAPGDSPNGI